MIDFRRFLWLLLMSFIFLAACEAVKPAAPAEENRTALIPATATAAAPTSTTGPATFEPVVPSPSPTRLTPTPDVPPPPATEAPELSYRCPLDPTTISGETKADGASVRVAFIAENGIQLWDEESETRELLFEAGDVTSLAFSDDHASGGRRLLAFTRQNERYQTSLWILNMASGNAIELLSVEDLLALNLSESKDLAVEPYRLAWIPGTHRLAFSTRTLSAGDGLPDVFREMRVIDAGSGELVELLDDDQGGSFTFSPDGAYFVLVSDSSVSLFKTSGEAVARDIVTYPALGITQGYYHPPVNWSADSRFFTFAKINTADGLEATYNRGVTSTIWRISIDGSASELATITGLGLDYSFSPDLEQVAYMRISPDGPPMRELHITDVYHTWDVVYQEGEGLFFGQWTPAAESLKFVFYERLGVPILGRLCQEAAPLPSGSGPGSAQRVHWVDAARYLYTVHPDGDLFLGSTGGFQKLVGRLGSERVAGKSGPLKDDDFYTVMSADGQESEPRPEPELTATLQGPERLSNGDAVRLTFSLTNHADTPVYVLKWFTPLEGIGGEIFRVRRDGQLIPYRGILAGRSDPTPDAYVLLEAGETVTAEVDLAEAYDFSSDGLYTIEFLSPEISHAAGTEVEMAKTLAELGPVPMPANEVAVQIEAETDPPAGSDQARETLIRYFALLSEGNYAEAAELHGAGSEMLLAWNPTADANDLAGLLKLGCTTNGLKCIPVKTIKSLVDGAPNTFVFALQFENPDGSLFELHPQGERPKPQSLFEFTVAKTGTGFVVQELPVYVP